MTHNQYIANIQYKIDNLFYEYDLIELGKYNTADYYNEYTSTNYYDTLMMEAEEKKGIIRRIIDGIMKIIRTAIDKVKSFFSKNKKVDDNAEVKVDSSLETRVDNFKKKTSKLKIGFGILTTALGAAGIPIIMPKVSAHMFKQANKRESKSGELEKRLSDITDEIRDTKTGEIIKSGDEATKLIRVSALKTQVREVTKSLEVVNKDLEGLLSKNPEDLGKSEKEFIQEVNKLSIEGAKLLDEIVAKINSEDGIKISSEDDVVTKYSNERDKYSKLQDKIADRYSNGQKTNNNPFAGAFTLDGGGSIMMDMSTSSGYMQGIILADLKNATAHCGDRELNTLANRYAYKCKKLADWCIKHAYHDNDYTEEAYDKIYSTCKSDYDSIMGKTATSANGGSLVVDAIKRITKHLNDVHIGAKKLQAIWDKNNK